MRFTIPQKVKDFNCHIEASAEGHCFDLGEGYSVSKKRKT